MAMTTEPAGLPAQVRPRRCFGVARWTVRILISISAVLLALQPVSIGEYLSGRYNMLGMHGAVADYAVGVVFLLVIAAIPYAILGGRVWVPLVAVALLLAVGMQLAVGWGGNLAIHVQLGVAIVGGAIVLAVLSRTPSFGRARARRSDRIGDPAAGSPETFGSPETGQGPETFNSPETFQTPETGRVER